MQDTSQSNGLQLALQPVDAGPESKAAPAKTQRQAVYRQADCCDRDTKLLQVDRHYFYISLFMLLLKTVLTEAIALVIAMQLGAVTICIFMAWLMQADCGPHRAICEAAGREVDTARTMGCQASGAHSSRGFAGMRLETAIIIPYAFCVGPQVAGRKS